MKVFLTGATGFIGPRLTQALLKRGWSLTALVRKPDGREAQALAAQGVQLVQGDIVGDRAALKSAMQGHDLVFHNAGWYELGVSRAAQARMRAANVDGTENVLGLAVELGVPRLVYTSSAIVLGDTGDTLADETFTRRAPPASFYERTKTEAHAVARRYQAAGAPLVIVSPGQVIGPGDPAAFGIFARMYVRGLFPPMPWAREGVFSMCYVDDVAEAMALGAERGRIGSTYLVAGMPITMPEIMDVWQSERGGFKQRWWLPRKLAWFTCLLAEPWLRLIGQPAFFSREVVNASYVKCRVSSALAEKELGAHFRSAEQAWRDTLAAERAALSPK